MNNKRGKLVLAVATVVLLLALALGSAAPGVAARVGSYLDEATELWAPQPRLLAPAGGGGSLA